MKKTEQQLLKKARRIQIRFNFLNDPKLYEGRNPTLTEEKNLSEIYGEWKLMTWIFGKYDFLK